MTPKHVGIRELSLVGGASMAVSAHAVQGCVVAAGATNSF